MIRAIIVDDEIQGRKLLKALLERFCPQVDIVDEAQDLPHAVKSIIKHKPDLVFLDIEMPGHSGLEIADFFEQKDINFSIIFTTAYTEYALQGYKLSAVDYLLKPIEGVQLAQAVNRFESSFKKTKSDSIQITEPNTIAIPIGQSIKFFELDQITHLKAVNSYTEIHFENNPKVVVSRTLKNFETALVAHTQFMRCHKSYIVNRKFVIDYVKSDGGYLIINPNIEIPISSERIQDFLSFSIFIKR